MGYCGKNIRKIIHTLIERELVKANLQLILNISIETIKHSDERENTRKIFDEEIIYSIKSVWNKIANDIVSNNLLIYDRIHIFNKKNNLNIIAEFNIDENNKSVNRIIDLKVITVMKKENFYTKDIVRHYEVK